MPNDCFVNGLDFRALSEQERISRLEVMVQKLSELVCMLLEANEKNSSDISVNPAVYRQCDGEVLLRNKFNEYRALFDNWFSVQNGDLILTRWDNDRRTGFMGLGTDGSFFVIKNDLNLGERILFKSSIDGILIRDQNQRLGSVSVNSNGFLVFNPVF